jgi:hypothetical protein
MGLGNRRITAAPPRVTAAVAAALVMVGVSLQGCSTADAADIPADAAPITGATSVGSSPGGAPSASAPAVTKLPANGRFDYQIGHPYPLPDGVRVVSRDRSAPPAAGAYNICYVNAFQTQPGELSWWKEHHDDLLLRDAGGGYVVDNEWDEILLDISTPAKRTAVASIVTAWIDGCATDGYDGVEPDNIDSYERSAGLLDPSDGLAFLGLLTEAAHAKGIAIGQKNAADLAAAGRQLGVDFAVVEECGAYDECNAYTAAYGGQVVDIEYTRDGFRVACDSVGDAISVVLRDLDVSPPGSAGYVYDEC